MLKASGARGVYPHADRKILEPKMVAQTVLCAHGVLRKKKRIPILPLSLIETYD